MKFLKETYMKDPTFGSRRAVKLIERETGEKINRKRIQRLKRKAGLKTIYCRPGTSLANEAHKNTLTC